MYGIVIVNKSTVVKDEEIQAALPDLQQQIDRDFVPVWGVSATLRFGADQQFTDWVLTIQDEDSDVPGALGYHDLGDDGRPVLYVLAKTTQEAGLSWTSVVSHELLETLADPFVNSCVFIEHDLGGRLIPIEACDAVESDLYKINSTEVSNFVFPEFFNPRSQALKVDYLGTAPGPMRLAKGGYNSFRDVTGGEWTQTFNGATKYHTPGVKDAD